MTDSRNTEISFESAELAFNSLAEQLGNIEAAIFTLEIALERTQSGQMHFQMFHQVFRMCVSWLVLTARKSEELWVRYGPLATPYTEERMLKALQEIKAREMRDLRNQSIAHVLDRKTKDPMTPKDIKEALNKVTQGNIVEFIYWFRHPDDPKIDTLSRALRLFRNDVKNRFPAVQEFLPVSTYSTANGDVQF